MYPPVVLWRVLLQPAQSVSENVQVGTAFLEICTTTEPWVCFFQIHPQSHHLFPVCCSWRCHVTRQLFCTVHDVSSVNGKKIGSCCQCSFPSGIGKAQNLSDQWLFLPNFLFSTMSSVLSRTSSLLSLDMGIFKDVKLDAPVSRMIASARSRSAS